MLTQNDLPSLKEKLLDKKMPEQQVNKVLAYISGALRDEVKQAQKGKPTPVSGNTIEQLYTLVFKYWNMGLLVDGVNVVITGNNMAMVTFHGYKNKVLQTYPETEFDVQLVREGDTFSVAKESGSVVYSHTISDPFGAQEHKIIGAYVVFKNKRGEFIETLNQADFEKMKKASKQSYLWGEWASEFWLKSVIKRACKRHFYDVVADIDKEDNEDYGIGKEAPLQRNTEQEIVEATSTEQLNAILKSLTPEQKLEATPLITKRMKELKDGNAHTS